MDSSQSLLTRSEFDSYHTRLQASALKATKHAASLPTDLAFHRSVDPDLARDLEACSNKVISITNTLLNLASTVGGSKSAKGKGKARVRDEDDFLDRFGSLIIEPMDQLFERADIALDQFSGRSKAPAIAINPPEPKKKVAPKGRQEPVIQHAPHLQKPQLKFKRKVDNTNSVWFPTLRHKFNARMPLGFTFDPASIGDHPDEESPPHPYRYEINNISYPAHMFQSQTPIPFKPFEETPFTLVSTHAHLTALIDKLRESREIAIDLEYHSYRTYSGFVCLMQISTRDEDWIVDPFELRDELEDLNEVFTDPSIVKVLHGADSDVVWLQQDFNLYLVNMFDTFHASKVLDFPRHGLAALLEMYCDFSPDKRYQLADWRIRYISRSVRASASSDTTRCSNMRAPTPISFSTSTTTCETLSSIAPSRVVPLLRAVLVLPQAPDAFVREVLSRSAETALRGGTGFNGWDSLARRWNKPALGVDGAPTVQREVFHAVHVWRDRVAREEDESTGYVLSNRFVFKLVEQPPADMAALLQAFRSTPPVVRRHAKELLDVIRGAVRKGLGGPAAPSEPAPIVSSEATPQQIMDVDVSSEHADPACASASLWSGSKPLPTSTTSSLFGAATVLPRLPSGYSTSQSSLFGLPPTSAVSKTKSNGRFQDVVNRIHSTLVVAPTVPRAPQEVTAATTTETITSVPEVSIDGATAEIPFVPAALRQTAKPEVIDDAIVVVGQRQKKRKRTKKAGTTGSDDGGTSAAVPAETAKAKTEEVVPFDFASAPNILDEGERSEHEDGRTGKRRRQKKALLGAEYDARVSMLYGTDFGIAVSERGDFPAAPKDLRELRSGNVSHTFRP
ncbi:hypothetical protein EDB89DRAFT_2111416 [Lactarius sanguifluus]|nr:hypothetical protein EDB89DRAFT_2111416 [Lactarius sanguifluus]